MDVHKNARSCPASRALLVERVLEQGWSMATAAEAIGVSGRTGWKWLSRSLGGSQSRDRGASGWKGWFVALAQSGSSAACATLRAKPAGGTAAHRYQEAWTHRTCRSPDHRR